MESGILSHPRGEFQTFHIKGAFRSGGDLSKAEGDCFAAPGITHDVERGPETDVLISLCLTKVSLQGRAYAGMKRICIRDDHRLPILCQTKIYLPLEMGIVLPPEMEYTLH